MGTGPGRRRRPAGLDRGYRLAEPPRTPRKPDSQRLSPAALPQLSQQPDPFETTGDPGRYVPRPATERALAALLHGVEQPGCKLVLPGPPGTGKTLLLRLLAQRLAPPLRCVLLPYAALPAPALCAWVLDLLGESPSYDPLGAVIGHARRGEDEGGGLALLVDNAESINPDTARELARAVDTSGGALRLVAACEETGTRLLEVTWLGARVLEPLSPLSRDETAIYLAAHLGGLPPEIVERAGFDPDFCAQLHTESGGVPARINGIASQRLLRAARAAGRRPTPAQPAPAPATAAKAASRPTPAAARGPEPPPIPPPPAWARDEAAEAPPRERPAAPAASPAAEIPTSVLEATHGEDAEILSSLERAAGRLALAHSPGGQGAPSEGLEPGFERAMGRLALAEGAPPEPASEAAASSADTELKIDSALAFAAALGVEPEPARAPAAPAAESAPAAAQSAPPTSAPRAGQRREAPQRPLTRFARAAAVTAIAFAVGISAGLLWMQTRSSEAPSGMRPDAPEAAQVSVPESGGAAAPAPAQAPAPPATPAQAPTPQAEAAPALPPVAVGINATPWATIRVDGVEVGVTPLSGVELAPGPHRFEAQLPDGRVLAREVSIDAENRFVVFP